ncbi:MAG: hypothetical protein KGS61_02685, partial [Verrucomicrobia bacterium]|nr:hypothetical protein [Verrucomicrobiota bacterium]
MRGDIGDKVKKRWWIAMLLGSEATLLVWALEPGSSAAGAEPAGRITTEMITGIGDFWVLARDPPGGAPPLAEPFQRWVRLNGRTYRAHVYGRRSRQTSQRGIPLRGVAMGDTLALDSRVLRPLEPGEGLEPGTPITDLRAREQRLADAPAAVLAEMGGSIYRFGSRADLEGAEARLEAAEARPGLEPGAAQALLLKGRSPKRDRGPLSTLASDWTLGLKRVLIIRVDFSDLPGEPTGRDGTVYTAGYVQHVADTVIKPFFAASSYGMTPLSNTVTALYRMPQSASYYATNNASNQLHADAETAASRDYVLANYDRWLVLFSPLEGLPGSELSYGGLTSVGTRLVWLNGEFDFRSVVHELGHTFGLYHADLWQVSDGNPVSASGTEVDGGDVFDPMGYNFGNDPRTDFNPSFKWLLGWMSDAQVLTVTHSGTYRVQRFDTASASGVLALRLARDSWRDYWISIRRNFTNLAAMENGAYVIWGFGQDHHSDLLDLTTPGANVWDAALGVDHTLRDPVPRISVQPVAQGGDGPGQYLDIAIDLLLTITGQPTNQIVRLGQTTTFTVATDGEPAPTYCWQRQPAGNNTWSDVT